MIEFKDLLKNKTASGRDKDLLDIKELKQRKQGKRR
jgi:hypothetical protein